MFFYLILSFFVFKVVFGRIILSFMVDDGNFSNLGLQNNTAIEFNDGENVTFSLVILAVLALVAAVCVAARMTRERREWPDQVVNDAQIHEQERQLFN